MDWAKLKEYILAVQTEISERNGLPYCKNCGVDFSDLAQRIELIIAHHEGKE